MTRQLKLVNAGTSFGKWIREKLKDSKDGLNVINIDTMIYILSDYKKDRLMLIEEKANGDQLTYAQGQTFKLIDKALRIGCKEVGLDYRGIHLVSMNRDRPDTSNVLNFDAYPITEDDLIKKLNME